MQLNLETHSLPCAIKRCVLDRHKIWALPLTGLVYTLRAIKEVHMKATIFLCCTVFYFLPHRNVELEIKVLLRHWKCVSNDRLMRPCKDSDIWLAPSHSDITSHFRIINRQLDIVICICTPLSFLKKKLCQVKILLCIVIEISYSILESFNSLKLQLFQGRRKGLIFKNPFLSIENSVVNDDILQTQQPSQNGLKKREM